MVYAFNPVLEEVHALLGGLEEAVPKEAADSQHRLSRRCQTGTANHSAWTTHTHTGLFT